MQGINYSYWCCLEVLKYSFIPFCFNLWSIKKNMELAVISQYALALSDGKLNFYTLLYRFSVWFGFIDIETL